MRWRVIPYGAYSASLNMAIDHMLLEEVKTTRIPTIRFYGWTGGGVSIGQHQQSSIVNMNYCDEQGIGYVRRPTGGNVVYHHPQDPTYAVIAPADLFGPAEQGVHRQAYQTICGWIVQALQGLGIPASLYGANDIIVNGKKVCGNAQRVQDGIILQHGALFCNAQADAWAAALHVPLEKLHGITSLSQYTHADISAACKKAFLHNNTVRSYVETPLSSAELERASVLALDAYGVAAFRGTGEERKGNACIIDIQQD